MTLTPGQMLQNRYRIMSLLGQGGMGAVYRAWDTRLNVPVALKEMTPQPGLNPQLLAQLREQFRQEAQVLARLHHPHLVRVSDFFEERGNAYLVMDFVEGESMAERIRRQGPLSENQVLTWGSQLLDALAYCHGQGIIHRDIKPHNVIIRSDGRAMLVDFGLVKLWDPHDPHTRTAMRGMGTPEYAPPEQYDIQAGYTDARSDIYSLGATFYHALTGQSPPTATMRIASPGRFQPPRTVNPRLSSTTEAIVLRATELAVENRFSSAQEMAAALRGELPVPRPPVAPSPVAPAYEPTVVAMPAAEPPAPAPAVRRKRTPVWIWALGGLAALVLIVGVAGTALLLGIGKGTPTPVSTVKETEVAVAPAGTEKAIAPSPTHTPTTAATDTPSPTPTPTTEATATPSPTPTPTTEATAASSPTPTPTTAAKPTATPVSGKPTPTHTPKPTSPPSSGALITFEQWGGWRRGDQPHGELTQTQEQVKTGNYAAKLSYDFPASGDDYVVFVRSLSLSGQPNTISAWVFGDGSGHYLNTWIQDAQDEIWSVHLGKVGSARWTQMSGTLDPGQPWPSGHISGPENGVIDYPVRFYALVLDRPGSGSGSGKIYIDDISAWRGTAKATATPAATGPTPTAPAAPTSPPPSGQVGRILYTIDAGQAYYLATTDPSWSQGQVIDPVAQEESTCAGKATAQTLTGQKFDLYYGYSCGIGYPKDCPSPDGEYKVVIWWKEETGYSLSVYRTSDDTLVRTPYIGPLNSSEPLLWAPTSTHFYFTVNHTLHGASPHADGYQAVIPIAYEPYLSPEGTMIVYLQPVGTAGAYDVWVAYADGSNAHNVTNAPDTYKMCARWKR